jgi:hypothetical protein
MIHWVGDVAKIIVPLGILHLGLLQIKILLFALMISCRAILIIKDRAGEHLVGIIAMG